MGFGGAAGTQRHGRWRFLWVALSGLLLLVLAFVASYQREGDPGVDLTIVKDDGRGHCTVRWTDPLDGRTRQGAFACTSPRDPVLRDYAYGWEASSWPWRGKLYNAEGTGTSAGGVIGGLSVAGIVLLLVAGVGGTVRITRHKHEKAGATLGAEGTPGADGMPGVGGTPGVDGTPGAGGTPGVVLDKRTAKPARSRHAHVFLLAGSAVAFTVCGVMLGVQLPHAKQRAHEFRAAVPCSSDTSTTNCLSTEHFTVGKVEIHNGRNSSYTADLTELPAGTGIAADTETDPAAHRRIHFDNANPLLHALHSGDTVRGTLWRGSVVAVTSDDGRITQSTKSDPTGGPSEALAGGVVFGVGGTVLLGFGVRAAYRRRPPAPPRPGASQSVEASGAPGVPDPR